MTEEEIDFNEVLEVLNECPFGYEYKSQYSDETKASIYIEGSFNEYYDVCDFFFTDGELYKVVINEDRCGECGSLKNQERELLVISLDKFKKCLLEDYEVGGSNDD